MPARWLFTGVFTVQNARPQTLDVRGLAFPARPNDFWCVGVGREDERAVVVEEDRASSCKSFT